MPPLIHVCNVTCVACLPHEKKRVSQLFGRLCIRAAMWAAMVVCLGLHVGNARDSRSLKLYRREEVSAGCLAVNILFQYVCSAPVTSIMGLKLFGPFDEFHTKGHRCHGALRTVCTKALRGP